jgi:hypothetical protein
MTIVHSWNVTVTASGDRLITDDEVAKLGEVVAPAGGAATGAGTQSYGVSLVLAAATREEACTIGTNVLIAAASRAGLPEWPVHCSAEGDGPPGGAVLHTPPTGVAAPDPDPGFNPELGGH